MRRLPSLNALRAFEVAARHASFTRAARELNVTQGAVSRQIKALEEELGVPLFRRLQRRVVLTASGRELLPPLTQAFDRIAEVTRSLVRRQHELTLKVQPTFAIRWLIPRLVRFQAVHPDIQVRLATVSQNPDFRTEAVDAAIIHGVLDQPGIHLEPIHTERLTPVCAPALCSGTPPLATPADLKHHRLLLNSADQREWRIWAAAAGVSDLPLAQGQVFDMDDAALQAAAAGFGVALGDLLLIRDDLRAGRLVAPFFDIPAATAVYHFATPAERPATRAATAFKEWILAELAAADPFE